MVLELTFGEEAERFPKDLKDCQRKVYEKNFLLILSRSSKEGQVDKACRVDGKRSSHPKVL